MKVVLEWLRRLRWCARLDPLIFSAIVISLWSGVSAAQTSGVCECDQQCPKTRELVTTVWGGAVTLFVLSFDFWGAVKTSMGDSDYASISNKVVTWITFSTLLGLNPLFLLCQLVKNAVWGYHMRRRMPGFTVFSLLLPWKTHPAKILCGCTVVITVPKVTYILDEFIVEPNSPSLLEAVVIGRRQNESQETKNINLGANGSEVLLQMDVLPPYDQLRVLQGTSGLAAAISSVQSMGYIYGVVVRTIQGLPVSPIEVVALTLSIQILIKALLHNIVCTCHRPLHVYLTDEQAQTFVDNCQKYTTHEIPNSQLVGPSVVIVLLVSSVAIYYIIRMWQATRITMVVPIMLTLVGFFLQLWANIIWTDNANASIAILTMCGMVNATSYIFALVVTVENWKVDRLNANTSSMLARIFPYIG